MGKRIKEDIFLVFLLLLSSFFLPLPAEAVISGSATKLTIANQGILPVSPDTAVLRCDLSSDTDVDVFDFVTVNISSDDGTTDTGEISSVSIWKDANSNDVFDAGDTLLSDNIKGQNPLPNPDIGSDTTIIFNDVTTDNWPGTAGNRNQSYFIVIKTANVIDHADNFYVTLWYITTGVPFT
ncbi:MAG: hypothetical protein V2A65_08135 [Candidatus Omnitrophota bacterium]